LSDLYVLDACALIAFLSDEVGAGVVESVLRQASQETIKVSMHKLNLLEVYYGDYRAHGKTAADGIVGMVEKLPIVIISDMADSVFLKLDD
jgi:PIN domain nuclease of toxin-antitoxin system